MAGGVVLLRPGTPANRFVRRQLGAVGKRLRYLGGQLRGVRYRLSGRRPDPDVFDTVPADRVRSSLGGLEKRLDIPRVHVMVENHVVLLHGEVDSRADADEIERAAAAVSGVAGVESHLRVGLIKSDTRPSEGRAVERPSAAFCALVEAAVEGGASSEVAPAVVHGILATFAERIPEGERDQVAAHLPNDVRSLFTPPSQIERATPPRTVHDLVARIAATTDDLPPDEAEPIVASVVQALCSLVPDERSDVAAVLPTELRSLWLGEPVGSRART